MSKASCVVINKERCNHATSVRQRKNLSQTCDHSHTGRMLLSQSYERLVANEAIFGHLFDAITVTPTEKVW